MRDLDGGTYRTRINCRERVTAPNNRINRSARSRVCPPWLEAVARARLSSTFGPATAPFGHSASMQSTARACRRQQGCTLWGGGPQPGGGAWLCRHVIRVGPTGVREDLLGSDPAA